MASSREEHFGRLVRELSPAIGAYLGRRLYPLPRGDLDDLVEETLIVLWRRLDDVPTDAELPWALGVARNVLRNAQRAYQRRENYEGQLRDRGASASAEDVYLADEGIRAALARLSDDDREILLLHAWDGLSAEDLARSLLITPNAAAVRLSRAQSRFKEHLDEVIVP
ncbi:MAG TPA: sigma-70 family RNA polymerase sigma factor [Acidimicrobiales bacterium]|jgi:RNA polymerase sigma-70 factor (ECF subfamily)